jgi:hypothetical protein
MSIEKRNFKYPLTCCSINDIFKEDSDLFNRAITCAVNGSNIYEIVRIISLEIFFLNYIFVFFRVVIKK